MVRLLYDFIERLSEGFNKPYLSVITDWNGIEQLLVAKFGRDEFHHYDINEVVRYCYDLDKSYSFNGVAVPILTKILERQLTSNQEQLKGKGRTAILRETIERTERVFKANYKVK